MDVNLEMTGDMNVSKEEPKQPIDFSNLSTLTSKIPSVRELYLKLRQNIRPWSEFLQTQNFKSAANLPRLSARFPRNLAYFQSNYLCIFFILMIYCLITSPLILIVLVGVLYSCYKIQNAQIPITLFGRQLNSTQQCMVVNVAALPVLYLVGAGAAMFWTIGVSCFFVSLHAIFYNIDAIVTEDMEGFLSEVV